jgi:heat shock protein HslJ
MKVRFEIIMATFLGLVAICMNCNASQKASGSKISIDTVPSVNAPLFETHWKLVELMGHKIHDSSIKKEMYLVLKKAETRVDGNGGCNAFSSTFTLQNNRITFGPLVSTKMFCQGIEAENEFFKALSSADHYYLKADTLSLTQGKVLRVAKFEAK